MIQSVNKAWAKSYDPALAVSKGQALQLVEQSKDAFPGWVWSVDESGLGGWLPDDAVQGKIGERGKAGEDFDTVELTVALGERVETGARRRGWVWCTNAGGASGWVPETCLHAS